MKNKPILIVPGQLNSIFFEIFFKALRLKKFKSPLILIYSEKILKDQLKKFRFNKNIKIIDPNLLKKYKLNNNKINLINIPFIGAKDRIYYQNIFLERCFDKAFSILSSGFTKKFINGPINKKNFLNKKYLGITEYISKKFKFDDVAMLIYNKKLSVCPVTTHLPLKLVSKRITSKSIRKKTTLIKSFYKKNFGFNPKIAVTGLNPHCESIHKYNEDDKILKPVIKSLYKSKFKIYGPYPADTVFLKKNRLKFDVIIGMYHDQVLSPMKTIFEYDAINITLGLPFLRISPDHGPNETMVGKNISNPISLINAITFLDKR
tara:strand:+ start:6699 stop:7655 length:957 start_codon:yes stop_codon:yes gene_type:complete